ncbi:MAG TPA: hypothetical protein VD996_07205 [Chitinophagaceae bacterium]|nr:hypothetical protein [Chitinophagaceae bacterium]
MKLITTLKKTVTSIQDLLDLGLNRNKPRFLFIENNDPAGNPRTNVYRRDIDLGSPSH